MIVVRSNVSPRIWCRYISDSPKHSIPILYLMLQWPIKSILPRCRGTCRHMSASLSEPNLTSLIVQETALSSRQSVIAVIEELEKLIVLLEDPLRQEVATATERGKRIGAETARPKKSEEEWEAEMKAAVETARKQVRQETESKLAQKKDKACTDSINALLDLLYFGGVLDPYNPYNHERHACLAYATATGSTLTSEALDTLGFVSRLLTTRPFNAAAMSHKDALEACKQAAVRYVLSPNTIVHPTLPTVRGQDLKETIKAVKALDYFVVVPTVNVTPGIATPALAVPPPAVGAGVGIGMGGMGTIAGTPVPAQEVETSGPIDPQPGASLDNNLAQQRVVKVQPHKVIDHEENLMDRLFGGQHQFQGRQGGTSDGNKAPPTEQVPEADRAPAFAGDYDLGIENVQIVSSINPDREDQAANPNGQSAGRGGSFTHRHQTGGRWSEHGRPHQPHRNNPRYNPSHNSNSNGSNNKPRGGGPGGGRFRGGRGGRPDYNRKPREGSRPEQE